MATKPVAKPAAPQFCVHPTTAAAEFRSLAEIFRRFAADPKNVSGAASWELGIESRAQAETLLIRAFHRGFLPAWPGLAESVERFENPPPRPPGVQSWTCPTVWGDVFGLNKIPMRLTDEGPVVVGDTHGGILPTMFPEVFPGNAVGDRNRGCDPEVARWDHFAVCCELLARVIEGQNAPAETMTVPLSKKEIAAIFHVGKNSHRSRPLG